MAVATVTERTRRQAGRLKSLRERTGIDKVTLSQRLGFGSTQTYDLYERPKSIIRLDRIEDWADAFRMPPLDFVAALLFDEDERELHAKIAEATDDPGIAFDMYRDLKPKTPAQRDATLQASAKHLTNLRRKRTD